MHSRKKREIVRTKKKKEKIIKYTKKREFEKNGEKSLNLRKMSVQTKEGKVLFSTKIEQVIKRTRRASVKLACDKIDVRT